MVSRTAAELRTDAVGIFWACLAVTWTTILVSGIVFLARRRNTPLLRVRGLPLSFCAIGFLHCYWISVQLGYIVGPKMPDDAEYWIMGLWLPLGIALFHASNARLLHVSRKQRRFLQDVEGDKTSSTAVTKSPAARFQRLGHGRKVFILVGAGMLFQILVTVLMYILSRKWHSSWGIRGTEIRGSTEAERRMNMTRGWEWWPSVLWQILWAWVVAPFILWQSRGIRDAQGWRLQTIACCIASLPAAPMWLVALYVPQMSKVNEYFIPPQWIAISIMFIEIFTILLPVWEVLRHQNLQQETLDSIAQWEAKNRLPVSGAKSVTSGSTLVGSASIGVAWKSTDVSIKSNAAIASILNMGALEHVLERNPGPLLEFSVLKDFSGENIAFLTSLILWRTSMRPTTMRNSLAPADLEVAEHMAHEHFNRALRIYATYVSPRDAEFQINLPSQCLKNLEAVFEKTARLVYGEQRQVDPVVPFEVTSWPKSTPGASKVSLDTSSVAPSSTNVAMDTVQYCGDIPEEFNGRVFDEAEAHVKYLVLTNTWPKFVRDWRSSMISTDSA